MSLAEALNGIKRNLEKNGYPTEIVSFPSAQLASYCHKQEISLSNLLAALEEEGIHNTFVGERIRFSSTAFETTADNNKTNGPRNPIEIVQDLLGDVDLSKLQEVMAKNPDKKPSYFDMLKAIGPGKLKDLAKKAAALSKEERDALMNFAKNMGVNPPGA